MTEKQSPAPGTRIRALGTETSDIVAANIKVLREAHGWSFQDLSWQLYTLGYPLSAAAIGNIERRAIYGHSQNPRAVTVDELLAFAHALGVDPAQLLKPVK